MPGFTHPVTDVYLDDILPLIGFQAAGRFAERPQAGDSKPRLTAEEQANVDEALMQTFLDTQEGCFEDLLEVSPGSQLILVLSIRLQPYYLHQTTPEPLRELPAAMMLSLQT